MKKMVNGIVYDMTPEEIEERLAEEDEYLRIKQEQKAALDAKAALPSLEEQVNDLNAKLNEILVHIKI